MEADSMVSADIFRAVLLAILDYLKNGETERAIAYIETVLNSK